MFMLCTLLCRSVAQYRAAEITYGHKPQNKFGWGIDDSSGPQVYGNTVNTTSSNIVKRRKFGRILKLKEAGLLAEFNLLPNNVERDTVSTTSFDAKYFEATFNARPYMASFHPLRAVNKGEVFHNIDRPILTPEHISYCKGVATDFFIRKGVSFPNLDGTTFTPAEPLASFGGLTGGAYYDKHLNTMYTPSNIFWARFNDLREGRDPSASIF